MSNFYNSPYMGGNLPDNMRKPKFTTALGIVIAIRELQNKANEYACANNFIGWNLTLDAIWRELAEDEKVKDEDFVRMREVNDKLVAAKFFETYKSYGFNKPPKEKMGDRSVHYQLLQEKEIFLRKLQHRIGKGSTYEDSVDDYMES